MKSTAMIGAGAIGGSVAAGLGDAGESVTLCVRTPFEKLERELDGKLTAYDHPVLSDPAKAIRVNWLMVCTQAHQTAGAALWFEGLLGSTVRVAVLQNSVDPVPRLRPLIGENPIVPAVIILPAIATAPGKIHQGRAGTATMPDNETGREYGGCCRNQKR